MKSTIADFLREHPQMRYLYFGDLSGAQPIKPF
jgi:hypothetical protein